jgi:hypothetical protein
MPSHAGETRVRCLAGTTRMRVVGATLGLRPMTGAPRHAFIAELLA